MGAASVAGGNHPAGRRPSCVKLDRNAARLCPRGGVSASRVSPGRGGGAAAVRGEGRLEQVQKTCDKTELSERLETCSYLVVRLLGRSHTSRIVSGSSCIGLMS